MECLHRMILQEPYLKHERPTMVSHPSQVELFSELRVSMMASNSNKSWSGL